jgi:hypothetical protein
MPNKNLFYRLTLRYILFFFFFSSTVTGALAQDLIVFGRSVHETITCKIISCDNAILSYTVPGTEGLRYIPLASISTIRFGADKDQLDVPGLIIDTLECTITGITGSEILYYDEHTGINHNIKKSQVVYCQFGSECDAAELSEFRKIFIEDKRIRSQKFNRSVILKDGTVVPVEKVEISEDKVMFEKVTNEMLIQTFTSRDNLHSFTNFEIIEKSSAQTRNNYLLSNGGSFFETVELELGDTAIKFSFRGTNSIVSTRVEKMDICALTFYNYPKHSALQKEKLARASNPFPVEFNVNGQVGRLLAKLSDEYPESLTDYGEELKTGYGFSANLNFFLNSTSGIGFMYKFLYQHNSIDNIDLIIDDVHVTSTSDKINTNLFGVNYCFRLPHAKKISYEFVTGAGAFKAANNSTINNYKFKITGLTPGVYMSHRFVILGESAGMYLDLSLVYAQFSEYNIEDQDIELDEKDTHTRVELGIGVKLH